MTDTRKYTENKTQAELLEVQRNSVVGGDVHKAVTLEIQRIQQDTNNIQIAKLIGEIQTLRNITEKNAETSSRNEKSSIRVAKWAFILASVSTLVAVLDFNVYIGWPDSCNYLYDSGHPSHEKCLYRVEFGSHSYFWEDDEYVPLKLDGLSS